MSSDIQFETFLLVSYKKFSILVIKTSDLQKIYQEEIQFSNNSNQINLDELNFELANDDIEQQALSRISTAISKYMPFVSLEGFEAFTEHFNNQHTAKIGIRVTYGIPQLAVTNETIELILRVAG